MKPALFLLLAGLAGAAGAADFTLSSPTVKPHGTLGAPQVFNGFGCTGGNVSPALAWQNPPAGTRSFALTTYDPDAPTGSGWWHWVVYNIPATVSALPEDAGRVDGSRLPEGAQQGRTDYGVAGFGGACPPVGDKPHRYQFTLHALKTDRLEVPADASAALIGFMISGQRLGSVTLQATYGR